MTPTKLRGAASSLSGAASFWTAALAVVWTFNLLGAAFAVYVYFGGPLP